MSNVSNKITLKDVKDILIDRYDECDIIDLQSMADGVFKYLLNYIDHGVKLLFSVPLTSKCTSAIALALYHIFCTIGPPMILQMDNARKFSGAATLSKQR